MVDTTPLNQNPQDDEPGFENTAAPIAAEEAPHAPAPTASPATVPVSAAPARTAPSRRGLVLAGSIVAAVIVLGETFGGGVLVGTSLGSNHGVTDARQAHGGAGFQGGPGRAGGPGREGGAGSQDSTNGGSGIGTNGTRPLGAAQGNGPRGGIDGSTDSTTG